jgi:hypothetical protein
MVREIIEARGPKGLHNTAVHLRTAEPFVRCNGVLPRVSLALMAVSSVTQIGQK